MIGMRSGENLITLKKRTIGLLDPSFRSARPWIECNVPDVENASIDSLSVDDSNNPLSDSEIEIAYRCALEILEDQTEDVVASLTQYYQKKGVLSIRSCFSEQSTTKKKGFMLWRCSFRCPLTGSEVSSSLPFSLLERPGFEEFQQLIKKKFGDYVICHEKACFCLKKAAKKSCALAMLITMLTDKPFEDMAAMQAPKSPIFSPGKDPVSDHAGGIFFSTWINEWVSVPFEPLRPSYLYEMAFFTESGAPWTMKMWNLDESNATRIGILFAVDIDKLGKGSSESEGLHRAVFSVDNGGGRITVQLRNRTVIAPITDKAASCRSLASLKQVNRAIMSWKSYGIGFHKEAEEKASRYCRASDLDGRTYLFVPLKATETTLRIDWDVIDDEVSLRARSIVDANDSLSQEETSAAMPASSLERDLFNKILVHRKIRYIATHGEQSINGHSRFPAFGLTDAKIERMIRRYDLDLRNASFCDYYLKRYGTFVKMLCV